MTRFARGVGAAIVAAVLLAGCAGQPQEQILLSKKGAVELRVMQSRAFDTTDSNKMLRAVIATLQDLGYSIDKVEPKAATVSATKLAILRMSVAIYPRGESQLIVRSNALVEAKPGTLIRNQVDDPAFYQQRFFEPLSKAIFLTALQLEEKDDAPEPSAN